MAHANEERQKKILIRHKFQEIEDEEILASMLTALGLLHKRPPAYIRVAGTPIVTMAVIERKGAPTLWQYDGLIRLPGEFFQIQSSAKERKEH